MGLQSVLKHRPNLHEFDDQGQTPLHLSCASMSGRIVKLLLKYGAGLNVLSKWSGDHDKYETRAKHFGPGLTALHFCAGWGNTAGVIALLEARADVNAAKGIPPEGARDTRLEKKRGTTALHYAAFAGHGSSAQLLLAHRASVNKVDGAGSTALDYAQKFGHTEVMRVLT